VAQVDHDNSLNVLQSAQRDRAAPVDINHHYNGLTGRWKGFSYRNPTLHDAEKGGPIAPVPQHFHRDVLKRETYRPRDLARYISPTYGKPSHLLVQAASGSNTLPPGEWRRRKVTGNAPWLLQVASWAIGLEDDRLDNIPLIIGKSILVMPAIVFLVAYPMGNTSNSIPKYPNFPSRCYEYPKHARNQLDAVPNAPTEVPGQQSGDKHISYKVKGEQKRLLRPRALVVFQNNRWETVQDGSYTGLYIFISFAAAQFQKLPPSVDNSENKILDEEAIDLRARRLAKHLGVSAYWTDFHCRAKEQPDATDDVHRFCDVVRGAHQVCVVLPDNSPNTLVTFGQRLWCLPEVLLCRNHQILLCTPNLQGSEMVDATEMVNIMEMVHRAWAVRLSNNKQIVSDGNEENFRLLVEHYTGTVTLSRLELIQVALTALLSRDWHNFQRGDIAYALMTLLSKRPRMDPSDTEGQALARLSLANDSDRIVERMACMDQPRLTGKPGWFNMTDDLGANLWDIEPLCQVAGVCHDGSIILDGCHGISIRWKDIPRIHLVIRRTWKKRLAALALRSGPLWFIFGVVFVSLPKELGLAGVGGFFLTIGILLLVMAPWSVATLYGGKVWGAKPWLIGFEGTLPLREIEHLTFGNSIGRLTYTPSSGPYCSRRDNERIGADPSENFGKVPRGQRLFTLIDTVSIFYYLDALTDRC